MDTKSVKTRYMVSIGATGLRALMSFAVALLLARGLEPSGYGELSFLLGSFVAVRSLLDLGTSSAFYTFISQKGRHKGFYLAYMGWLGLQFALTVIAVGVILPDASIKILWLGHGRGQVLLAFAAVFMQQQLWQAATQYGESRRMTVRVQAVTTAVAFVHILVVALLLFADVMSVSLILWAVFLEYLAASFVALRFFRETALTENIRERFGLRKMAGEYMTYCRPLVLHSVFSFAYEFADRWVLQRAGGAAEQGYYQIAYQFATAGSLAVNSIFNVLWKEIAEAYGMGDKGRVEVLVRRTSRLFAMSAAALSGFLIPWASEMMVVLLGASYAMAAPVLTVMLFYPVFYTIGNINCAVFLATGRTRAYTAFSVAFMAASLPVTYFALAPESWPVPGLGLGALGLALKIVVLTFLTVNAQSLVIARLGGWRFDWSYQFAALGLTLAAGFAARLAAGMVWDLSAISGHASLAYPMAFSGILYVIMLSAIVWSMPRLIASDRSEIRGTLKKLVSMAF